MTDDLIAFLNARLDEDEAAAHRELRSYAGPPGRHKAAERTLREVEAKRARLALMIEVTAEMDKLIADDNARTPDQAMAVGRARAATVAVKHDATVYSDHPDYRPEWKP